MTDDPEEVMIVAGQDGGKSTFLGGVATKMKRSKRSTATGSSSWTQAARRLISSGDLVGNYEVTHGNDDLFESQIVDQMRNAYAYPDQTRRPDTYIVEFNINDDQSLATTTTVAAMDIPGEAQENALDYLLSDDYDRDEVRDIYLSDGINSSRGSIKERIDSAKPIIKAEWPWAYLYHYIRSRRVIFLVNVYKAMYRDDLELVLDSKLLEEMGAGKDCLLLFTAVDTLDYDPDDYKIGGLSGRGGTSSRYFDDDLASEMEAQMRGTKGDQVLSLVETAREQGMDMFSVAVPSDSSPKDIQRKQGRIVLQGFDNIGKWIKNTE